MYEPLGFAVVRAPLLPVETYLSLGTRESIFAWLDDPRVRRAVAAGSVSLLQAIDRHERSALTTKDAERLKAKLLRYLIRMSTRPTPYGLFAGCASVRIAEHTDLTITSTFGCSHTRPDMVWLMDLVATAESDPAIRRCLRLTRNPLIRHEGDRIALAERVSGGNGDKNQPVSVRATSVVTLALEIAKDGIAYSTLTDRLVLATSRATPEKVERLLTELWEQTFLLTDLRPPLTTDSPARYVLDRLASIPEAAAIRTRLETFLNAAALWDQTPHEASVPAFRTLLGCIDGAEDGPKDPRFQTDMALSVEGRLGSIIAEEAARAAQLLLRLSPTPRGLSSLAAYRNAFVARYGIEREVGVLELLDPHRGLGSPSAHGHAFVGPEPSRAETRSRTLLALATSALHKRQRVVHLDEKAVAKLETFELLPENAPVSLDVNLLVAARSAAAIDQGEFSVVIGPNLGAWAAGRNFGRFAHLHPPEEGREFLASAARTEQTHHFADHVCAEVVYLPANVRSANVAIRPSVRSHEVIFGVSPGVAEADVIPLEELVVGVTNNRFYVRWTRVGKRVRFVSGHMLNDFNAPPIAQFLLQVCYDGLVPFTSFDWGPAEGFPFLPRVQIGRLVLRPAEWRISKESVAPADVDSFAKWRADWDVPRYVWLTFGDNRLIIDLDQMDHVAQLMTELTKLTEGRGLLIQEVLPTLEEAWLTGDEGHYYSEFIVPLVLCPFRVTNPREDQHERVEPRLIAVETIRDEPVRIESHITTAHRRFPPGSEWLFAKLYCSSHREDDLIAESLLPFADNVISAGLADCWFYVRYADPEGHIRLRFRGAPDRLSSHLFGQLCQWATAMMASGMCTRIVFDTYDRELERFGGSAGMTVAESLFYADSRMAAKLVSVLKSKPWANENERTVLLALAIDDLLEATGFDESKRREWYKGQVADNRRDFGSEYRKHKDSLRAALGNRQQWLAEKPLGEVIAAALTRRREDLTSVSLQLRQLVDARALDQSMDKLCASYTHLHVNRLGGASAERMLLSLLLRTRESLARAPFSDYRRPTTFHTR
ncbi:MAG: lantibiotic dehydratase [Gemmatimonadota bacterium]|nr:lantibiotic dehydratase [Gemmatimonadota bacterium]